MFIRKSHVESRLIPHSVFLLWTDESAVMRPNCAICLLPKTAGQTGGIAQKGGFSGFRPLLPISQLPVFPWLIEEWQRKRG